LLAVTAELKRCERISTRSSRTVS